MREYMWVWEKQLMRVRGGERRTKNEKTVLKINNK
jgi:hypothetical protein